MAILLMKMITFLNDLIITLYFFTQYAIVVFFLRNITCLAPRLKTASDMSMDIHIRYFQQKKFVSSNYD